MRGPSEWSGINAHRGMILDQQGKPMAVSSPRGFTVGEPVGVDRRRVKAWNSWRCCLRWRRAEFNSRLEKNS